MASIVRYQAIKASLRDEWENWILFMLKAVEATSVETIEMVKGISRLMMEYKAILRPLLGKQYKHELINNLFFHPYTKIDFFQRDLMIGRQTAAKYLKRIVDAGLLTKYKLGRDNYYVNTRLMEIFIHHGDDPSRIASFAPVASEA